jgi:hypothetical protein
MWMFLPFGVFSVVSKAPAGDHEVLVRVRVRGDLDELRKRGLKLSRTTATPSADYPFRAVASRQELADFMSRFLLDELTYGNFKDEVARVQGHERSHVYHQVWDVLARAFARARGAVSTPRAAEDVGVYRPPTTAADPDSVDWGSAPTRQVRLHGRTTTRTPWRTR